MRGSGKNKTARTRTRSGAERLRQWQQARVERRRRMSRTPIYTYRTHGATKTHFWRKRLCSSNAQHQSQATVRENGKVERLKRELLVAIGSGEDKGTIVQMTRALESSSEQSLKGAPLTLLDGRWSLLYSTQMKSDDFKDQEKTLFAKLLALLYKVRHDMI